MDDLERLAARINFEIKDVNRELTRQIMGVTSGAISSDRQLNSVQHHIAALLNYYMQSLVAASWAWAESLRLHNGAEPSSLVDEELPIPAWDSEWEPEGD